MATDEFSSTVTPYDSVKISPVVDEVSAVLLPLAGRDGSRTCHTALAGSPKRRLTLAPKRDGTVVFYGGAVDADIAQCSVVKAREMLRGPVTLTPRGDRFRPSAAPRRMRPSPRRVDAIRHALSASLRGLG